MSARWGGPGRFPASRPWRLLYGAYAISAFGDEFTKIALLAKAYQLEGQLSALAWAAMSQALPAFVLSPLAGVLADRGHKRSLLLVSDFARCVVLLLIAAAQSLPQVIALAVVTACFTAIFGPVQAALQPDLLEEDEIGNANAIRMGTKSLLAIVGPAAVGSFLFYFEVPLAFVVDAATYALSGILLLGLPRRIRGHGTAAGRRLTTDLGAGLRFVLRQPELRLLLLVQSTLVLVMGMQGPLFFGFVADQLAGGGETFALLLAALGVGSLLGAYLLHRFPAFSQLGVLLLVGILFIDAAALMGFTFGRTVIVCAVFMAFMGLISAGLQIMIQTYLQTVPPADYRGRTIGIFAGSYGPLSVLSLALVFPLASLWESVAILRGAAVAELVVALMTLIALTAAPRRRVP